MIDDRRRENAERSRKITIVLAVNSYNLRKALDRVARAIWEFGEAARPIWEKIQAEAEGNPRAVTEEVDDDDRLG